MGTIWVWEERGEWESRMSMGSREEVVVQIIGLLVVGLLLAVVIQI